MLKYRVIEGVVSVLVVLVLVAVMTDRTAQDWQVAGGIIFFLLVADVLRWLIWERKEGRESPIR